MCMVSEVLKETVANGKAKRVKVKHPVGWVRPDSSTLLPLGEYDAILCAFSGGKDSVATLLELCRLCDEAGVSRSRIEAWHQCVDGEPGSEHLWDWPVTDAYCAAVCRALGITYRRQWREGGLTGELLKKDARTKPVGFELPDGTRRRVGGKRGKVRSRGRHPAQSADLRTRWCSPVAKIDVMSMAVRNEPRFRTARVLIVTGERRQESSNRATYATVERRAGTNNRRRVDQWRPILEWTEERVWETMKKHRIQPHPAYRLGFGRVSCMACIFNRPDAWATVRVIAPRPFYFHANVEVMSGHTIRKGLTVIEQADRGTPFAGVTDSQLVALAMGTEYPDSQVFMPDSEEWQLPTGAFRACGGPT